MTSSPFHSNLRKHCFVIAEAGVNHNGDLELARRLIDVAAEAGADAVKFQTFKADKLVTLDAEKAIYQKETTGSEESQHQMLRKLELSEDEHRQIYRHCQNRGILFLSTPFDEDSADFLEELGVSIFKMASGELTNLPFLTHVAKKGRPMIVSTGMSWLSEVEQAVRTIEHVGLQELSLLHCVSQYPTDPADTNLRAMRTIEAAFGYPVGFSDHTLGTEIPIAAVALGATIIEKHFTLDREMAGPDHRASLEPAELQTMVRALRNVERALGDGIKRPREAESSVAQVARKSLFVAHKIQKGDAISRDKLRTMRPGTGIAPSYLDLVTSRRARVDLEAGQVLTWDMIS